MIYEGMVLQDREMLIHPQEIHSFGSILELWSIIFKLLDVSSFQIDTLHIYI